MRSLSFAFLSLLLAAPLQAQEVVEDAAPATTRISGTLVGADGRPMTLSHIHLHSFSTPDTIASVKAQQDGAFVVETDQTGLFLLSFTGVDHLMERVYLLLMEGDDIALDVRLGPHAFLDDFSDAVIIGDFNDFDFEDGTRALEPQEDGTYALDVPVEADSLTYQIFHVAGTRSTNGTRSDRFVYDGGGDYRSVLYGENGTVRVVFDPDRLMRVEAEPEVVFRDEGSLSAHYTAFATQLTDHRTEFFELQRAAKDEGATNDEISELYKEFDTSSDSVAFEEFLASTEDPYLRAVLYVTYMGMALKGDSLVAKRALAEIPPGSPAWSMGLQAMTRAFYGSGAPDAYRNYALAVLRENESETVRADVLMYLAFKAQTEEKKAELELIYAWIMGEHGDSWVANMAKARFASDRAIQVGLPIPSFDVASLEDTTITFSNESLLGQTYLIDFWAVWCGPCIGEMEHLHAAYEKYREDGFTILSLSFDGSPEAVAEFREEEWPMPWLHTFVEDDFGSDMAERFNVVGIPRVILVGEDGLIKAEGGKLRREKLDETLAEYFGREPTPSDQDAE